MVPRRLHVQRIDRRLAEMNLTRDGFKAEVGLDRRTIERLLSGKTQNAQAQTVAMIAAFLGLALRDILLLAAADAAPPLATPHPRLAVAMRLPVTGAHLLGRAQELAWLDQAWACGETNIVSIVGLGGRGSRRWSITGSAPSPATTGVEPSASLGGPLPVRGSRRPWRRREPAVQQ